MSTAGAASVECGEQLARDLHHAVVSKNVERVKSVLGQGADPNHALYRSKEWNTPQRNHPPLHTACFDGYVEMMETLVEHGADKDGRDYYNMTPLHCACASLGCDLKVVQYLVEKANCDINVTNDYGLTPLDYSGGYQEIIEYLKSRQQSTHQKTVAGRKRASKSSDVVKSASKKPKQETVAGRKKASKSSDVVKSASKKPKKETVAGRKRSSKSSDVEKPASKKQKQHHVSQRTPQRECPNCGDSCHIRCRSCPHCEHQFQSSAKKQAKPSDEPKKKAKKR